MAKRAANFDRTVWDTGVSPVARGKAERCSVCKRTTPGRLFWVDEQMLCEGCAEKTVTGGAARSGSSVSRVMLFGVVAMVVMAVVYMMMHRNG